MHNWGFIFLLCSAARVCFLGLGHLERLVAEGLFWGAKRKCRAGSPVAASLAPAAQPLCSCPGCFHLLKVLVAAFPWQGRGFAAEQSPRQAERAEWGSACGYRGDVIQKYLLFIVFCAEILA